MSELKIDNLFDPRGYQKRIKINLAKRPTLEELKRGKVIFYNNTKLEFCNYGEIFHSIKRHLVDRDIKNFVDYRETVRGKTTRDLKDYAKTLSKEHPTAAIVALGDMGTSVATTIVAIALEELGIPCVYITASPGTEIAKGVAFYRAGHLCLCPIKIYQGNTKEDVRAQIDKNIDCIINSLTLPADQIEQHAAIDFALDKEPPAKDGFLQLPEGIHLNVTNKKMQQPGSFMEELMDIADFYHISDGLPFIPPTKDRLKKMLSFCPFDPDMVLASEIGPSGKDISVRDVAIAAIMAGCKPKYMPILVTAFKAMANPKYNFLQSVTTSHPGGNLVLVSGPLSQQLGIYGGQGCLGPGFSANATIGRAVNLVIINVSRSVPGYCDLDCIGSQAEFTYCFSEDPKLTPWETINSERYDKETTIVYVLKAEPPHDIIDFLSQTGGDLLDTIVHSSTTLGSNNAYIPGNIVFIITRDHAWLLERDDYNKEKIRKHIHQHACHEAPMVRNRGLMPVRPKGFDEMHPIPVTRSPEDIEIVVAGGRGGHSAVILPWALRSEAIIERVLLPNGKVPTDINDFKTKS